MVVIILMSPQNSSVNENFMTALFLAIVVILLVFFITRPSKNSNEVVDSTRQNSNSDGKLNIRTSVNKINQEEFHNEITRSQCGSQIIKEDIFC